MSGMPQVVPMARSFASGTYKVFSVTPGVGPVMKDQECVTFFPEKKGGDLIRVTSHKGKFVVGSKYRIKFEAVKETNVAS